MTASGNDLEFWRSRWAAGQVDFSVGRDDSLIAAHWPALQVAPGSRVLVPMAGASPDLAWLAAQGYDVVGVEVSPVACEEFFRQRDIAPERSASGRFTRWRGGGVTMLQGDVFDLEGRFDALLDRGALVALPERLRSSYATHLRTMVPVGAAILLVTIEYDGTKRSGPPYPVLPAEVRSLFPEVSERSRHRLLRARWEPIGGAEAVLWTATSGTSPSGMV